MCFTQSLFDSTVPSVPLHSASANVCVCVLHSLCSYNAVPSVPLYSASASVCVCVLHSLCFYNAVTSVPLHTETAVASVCVFYTVFVFKTQSRQFHCTRLVSECVFYTVFVLFYNAVPSVPLHTTGILHSLCFYNTLLSAWQKRSEEDGDQAHDVDGDVHEEEESVENHGDNSPLPDVTHLRFFRLPFLLHGGHHFPNGAHL